MSEDALRLLLLDAVNLQVPASQAAGTSAGAADSDDDADGGWVLISGAASGHRGCGGGGGGGSCGAAALRLLPDPVVAERLFCVAGGAAWALTLRWLPALASLLAHGAPHRDAETQPDARPVTMC